MSQLEAKLLDQIRSAGLPEPLTQIRFAKKLGRQWRFDMGWQKPHWFAVECDGATFSGGRHGRGQGAEQDNVKLAVAALLGWFVVRVTGHMIADGRAIALIRGVLEGHHEVAAEHLAQTPCKACNVAETRRRQRLRAKALAESAR